VTQDVKGQLEEPLLAIASMLGDFQQDLNLAPTPLRPMLAYYESELEIRWRGENGETSATREEILKILISNKYIF